MTFRIRLLCLALLTPGLAQANDLLRTYDQAVRNDSAFRAASFARDAALQLKPKARALLLPQLGASYDYVSNDADATVTYTEPTTGTSVPLTRKINGADRNLSVTLTQPLFSLEGWYQLKQADEQVALAELNYRTSEQRLVLRVAEAYFGVLDASEALRTAQAEADALSRELDLAKEHLAVGLASITDLQEVQARHDLSVASELAAEQALTEAREKLEEITHEPLPVDDGRVRVVAVDPEAPPKTGLAFLRDEIPLPAPQPADVRVWVGHARLENPDVIAALLNFRIAERGVDVAKARRMPTVSANVTYTDSDVQSGSFPYRADGTSVGVGVKLPLFAGGGVQADIRESVATREQRKAEYEGAQRQAERAIRTAYQSVVIGAARVRAYAQAMASSRSAFDANKTGLQIGTRSAIDVLNAQQQRYDAERNYAQSRYDYLLGVLRLKFAAGTLRPADLTEIDALLQS
ncbi:TolC family outer membrane protein [Solimonas soli]|uniref:TolC family outer membrane protein n=1 Tax=Solimonas soli TaxID=413479 RepID=UPI000485BEB6|nr:TolC family outer membrane protein [Solimonas soli]